MRRPHLTDRQRDALVGAAVTVPAVILAAATLVVMVAVAIIGGIAIVAAAWELVR